MDRISGPPMSLLWAPKTKDMLDPDAHPGAGLVALLLSVAQRLVALALAVDPAPQPLVLQLLLDLGRATGAVGPDIRGGVVTIEDLIRHLTVVHRGIAHVMVTHQLVTAVDVDVVLVAVMALTVF